MLKVPFVKAMFEAMLNLRGTFLVSLFIILISVHFLYIQSSPMSTAGFKTGTLFPTVSSADSGVSQWTGTYSGYLIPTSGLYYNDSGQFSFTIDAGGNVT